ncbi:alpha/beta fold hydrolase [Actinoplanes palleronii]|uniref:Alpha/beta hydrolase n=1 Tax=Actinoplanes palleronii TaxID=113570 RepID=A0ABQ4BFJ9_9ACTN|nr:alpha/beta hydrolase [Actinoplanes palleronii]GIE69458.1 alpha/beta hydrolase [Actinoplanes palleronii]
MKLRRTALAAITAVALSVTVAASADASTTHHSTSVKPTIVLVHGAWADGSSWAGVTERLEAAGYAVIVFANPLRGVTADSAALKAYLDHLTGPIVLAGHSYGGMLITNAASGDPDVTSLVYVDAFVPRQGDTVNGLTGESPGSALGDRTVFDQVGADLYIKQTAFPAIFAGGVPARTAARLAAGQRPLSGAALGEPSPNTPAYTTIPAWDVIGTADRVIPPAEQELMAARAGARVVRIKAPHLSMVSNPAAITAVITAAAR